MLDAALAALDAALAMLNAALDAALNAMILVNTFGVHIPEFTNEETGNIANK